MNEIAWHNAEEVSAWISSQSDGELVYHMSDLAYHLGLDGVVKSLMRAKRYNVLFDWVKENGDASLQPKLVDYAMQYADEAVVSEVLKKQWSPKNEYVSLNDLWQTCLSHNPNVCHMLPLPTDTMSVSALMGMAIRSQQPKTFAYLLTKYPDVDLSNAALDCLSSGSVECLKELIGKGVEITPWLERQFHSMALTNTPKGLSSACMECFPEHNFESTFLRALYTANHHVVADMLLIRPSFALEKEVLAYLPDIDATDWFKIENAVLELPVELALAFAPTWAALAQPYSAPRLEKFVLLDVLGDKGLPKKAHKI